MAWGARKGVDDLLLRLQQPKTSKNLCVLSVRKLTEADVKQLADAIASNTTLEELYLSGHKLGDAGVVQFADCLAVNTTLRHLSIGEDTLGDTGVSTLCSGIARNAQSALAEWNLEHKSMGAKGAAAVGHLLASNTSITTLNLARNPLGDDGVKGIVDGLVENQLSNLHALTLTEAGVSGAALDSLANILALPYCSLQSLQLSFNDLGSAGLSFFAALRTNTSLKKLALKECKLNDEHARALADALAVNSALDEVDLADNELTAASCVALADAFQANTTLRSMSLDNNKCGDDGALALGTVLAETNTSVERLDFSKNQLTHVGITCLLGSQSVKTLRLFNNALGDGLPGILPALVANSSIQGLDLGANALHGALSVTLFEAIQNHGSLRTLEMGGNSLGEQGHVALDKLREVNPNLDVAVDKNAQEEDGDLNSAS